MNEHELEQLLSQHLSNNLQPSKNINLKVINAAKQHNNQVRLKKEYKKTILAALSIFLPITALIAAFISIFIISNFFVQLIFITNVILGMIVILTIGCIGISMINHEKGVLI